jgi:hypothetical protein
MQIVGMDTKQVFAMPAKITGNVMSCLLCARYISEPPVEATKCKRKHHGHEQAPYSRN